MRLYYFWRLLVLSGSSGDFLSQDEITTVYFLLTKLTCRVRRDRRAQLRPLHRARPAGARAADGSSDAGIFSELSWWVGLAPYPACRQPTTVRSDAWSSLSCRLLVWPGRADTCLKMRNAG
jgi:hypothetical protein